MERGCVRDHSTCFESPHGPHGGLQRSTPTVHPHVKEPACKDSPGHGWGGVGSDTQMSDISVLTCFICRSLALIPLLLNTSKRSWREGRKGHAHPSLHCTFLSHLRSYQRGWGRGIKLDVRMKHWLDYNGLLICKIEIILNG